MDKRLEIDFKVDGKVVDTIKLRGFELDTLVYKDDVQSYTSAYLKVGKKHLDIQVIIGTKQSIADSIGFLVGEQKG